MAAMAINRHDSRADRVDAEIHAGFLLNERIPAALQQSALIYLENIGEPI
jgi:hypothetical protein